MKKILSSIFIIILCIVTPISFAQQKFLGYLSKSIELKVDREINIFVAETSELRPQVLHLALEAYECALQKGIKDDKQILTIIDYSLPSSVKRLWVLDLKNQKVLFHTLVAHGKYSGEIKAMHFSDQPYSLESSIGLFVTEKTYFGHDGYSLRIKGLEKGFNDTAELRHIVIHGAWYVSRDIIKRYGTIGRSWGCPALDQNIVKPVIDTIKDGTIIFAYYPNPSWLTTSTFFQCKN